MKKVLLFAAMAAMLLFTGCKKSSEFNKALEADYAMVMDEYPEAVLYEVETAFNDVFATRDRKNLHVVTAKEVFQVADTLVLFIDRNFDEGTVEKTLQEGFWCEDVAFKLDGIKDVNDALNALYNANILIPISKLMTLRNPLGPEIHLSPYYIFGDGNSNYVAVDSRTLKVEEFE